MSGIPPSSEVVGQFRSRCPDWCWRGPSDRSTARSLRRLAGSGRLRWMSDPAYVTVVVDAANCVGSVPDGWWRDRAGATRRLRDSIEPEGLRQTLHLAEAPEVMLVVE